MAALFGRQRAGGISQGPQPGPRPLRTQRPRRGCAGGRSSDRLRGYHLACNCASRDEVDRLFSAATAAGGQATKMPQEVFWGGYSGYVADPDGHLWEIAYNPFWPFDEQGNLVLP
ncbi:VOC family protein [Pseudomonas aeruginosa]|uniref:VOC family protein n=1 Tax=Pseudomonas aeruginosa TaxID=287 RepID=UPI0037C8E323